MFVLCFFSVFCPFFSLEQHLTAKKWEGRWGTGGGGTIYMYICIYIYNTTHTYVYIHICTHIHTYEVCTGLLFLGLPRPTLSLLQLAVWPGSFLLWPQGLILVGIILSPGLHTTPRDSLWAPSMGLFYGPLPSLKGSELWVPILKMVCNILMMGL